MEDLISRNDAIDAIKQLLLEPDSVQYIWSSDAMNAVRNVPTVDAVPVVHGAWVEHEDYNGDCYYSCSACGCDWTTIDGTPVENNMRFCPECGAKMDER